MSEDIVVNIVLPERSEDEVSDGLREITKALHESRLADGSGYGLGGEYGYGADFENDVFMLHPFCWCEKPDCKWCEGDAPNFKHKASNSEITWYKYIGRSMEVTLNKPWKDIFTECMTSINKSKP